MEKELFGNLKDWGNILAKIEEMVQSKKVGEHQVELIRLLRFKENWRLREAALEAVVEIPKPSQDLLAEVFETMMCEDNYYELRALAADALGKLLKRCISNAQTAFSPRKYIEGMNALLDSPQPPIFHEAVRNSLEYLKA